MLLATNALGGAPRVEDARTRRRGWNPATGHPAAPEQRPPAPAELLADGTVLVKLWVPTEGPCRTDPGGSGGGPDGRSIPIRKVVWD
jgi:hypothetical protein